MSHQHSFPADLPVPTDDGACAHLVGIDFPSEILLPVTPQSQSLDTKDSGLVVGEVSVAELSKAGMVVIFFYPRTAPPEENVPAEWNAIPGARGCTPQNCSFRDDYTSLLRAGLAPGHLFGCSTQSPATHAELSTRLHLPYALLSDTDLRLTHALTLPTFEWKGSPCVRRLTIAVENGKIVQVWYPVFPPDKNVGDVIKWLESRRVSLG